MFASILCGLLRHALTSLGGAAVSYGVHLVDGLPVVHNLEAVVLGGVAMALGGAASVAHKIKTESGPIYKTNE